MKTPLKRRNAPTHPVVWWSRNKLHWPVLVWLVAIGAAFFLYKRGIQYPVLTGIVEIHEETIAPVNSGVLKELFVAESQSVTNGQPLAQMDTDMVDQEIKAEEASGIEDAGVVERYQEDAMRLHSQYVNDLDTAEESLQTQKRALAEVKAEQDVLQKEAARLQNLVDQRLADSTVLVKLGDMKTRLAILAESARLYPQSIEDLERATSTKKKQHEDLDTWMDFEQTPNGPGQSRRMEQMKAQTLKSHEEQRNLLLLKRETHVFKAKSDGTVSRIDIRPGSTVSAGIPIMNIVHAPGNSIIAFLPEGQAVQTVTAGMKAHIIRLTNDMKNYDAVVQGLGPEIYTRTVQTGTQRQFMRGRRLILSISGPHDLIPGETVSIAVETRSFLTWLKGERPSSPNSLPKPDEQTP
jgi:multidrug resistance efflux pump